MRAWSLAYLVASASVAVGCTSSARTTSSASSGAKDASSGDAAKAPPPATDAGALADASTDSTRSTDSAAAAEASVDAAPTDAAALDTGMNAAPDAADAGPCTTRITYGAAWIHPANHPANDDVVAGVVTWDGTCTDDGANSYALLSNGFQPYFQGNGACILALDATAACGVSGACTTKVTYGPAWLPPANHPASYDVVPGRVFASGACVNSGGQSYEALSNGWQPTFSGAGACRLSLEYTQCGGLYQNPVIPTDCPDPGVLATGDEYVLSCTSGDAANAYPIYTSPDLATWTAEGYIFPTGSWPSWAKSDFWAPEIHEVGGHYVAYFSARNAAGTLCIGAASAASPLGPFTDIGQPLISDPSMGLIDASEINAPDGTPYVLWKEDGNAVGKPTPIHAQQLAPDGLSLVAGTPATLITNDQAWEGAVTEAPFMVDHGGTFYLFYSGNSYATPSYAVGVASATSPLGPFTKAAAPIVVTGGAWAGPGHCAVVDTPTGDTYMVYAAWESGCVNGAGCGRLDLTDAIEWGSAWPSVPFAPSSATRPLP